MEKWKNRKSKNRKIENSKNRKIESYRTKEHQRTTETQRTKTKYRDRIKTGKDRNLDHEKTFVIAKKKQLILIDV